MVTRPRLLVERTLGLGDLLVALPALRALAAAFPHHHRVLAVTPPLVDLARTLGVADAVVAAGELDPLPADLAGVDVAVNLHGRGPESHRRLLALAPARLVAFAHPDVPVSAEGPRWRADEHERERWCRLLRAHGIAADPDDVGLVAPPGPVPAGAAGATLVHPGAKSRARRWPAERFAAVARGEAARGRRVVVTGGPGEEALAGQVVRLAGLPAAASLAGRTDLTGLVRVVAAADRVVCGDTGVAHVATAVGTPSVVLFGPTSPARWGPPARRAEHRVLWAGRTGDPLGDEVDPGLLELTVDDVQSGLRQLDRLTAGPHRSAG